MIEDPAADLVRWVKEGEHLFRLTLESLQGAAALGSKVEELSEETRRLRADNETLRRELDLLRAERLEVPDTLNVFAPHLPRPATRPPPPLPTPRPTPHPAAPPP